jgi:FkbM family methyltransferase
MRKKIAVGNFILGYKNDHEATLLINEVFHKKVYNFNTINDTPLIIDCGAHIGVSILYFKSLYPDANIIAFEPNPVNYKLLVENVNNNKLDSVSCLNTAISDFKGSTPMYGNFHGNAESLGNSIQPFWGKRSDTEEYMVKVDKLSAYITDRQVDFLKLDTEGSEFKIIREIENKLYKFNNIFIEFHLINFHRDDYYDVMEIMQKQGFYPTILHEESLSAIVDSTDKWVSQNKPVLIQVVFKKEYKSF